MKILHLYHDIMNLYGEYGNIVLLTQVLTACGIEAQVVTCSLWEKPDFTDVDFLYLGAGTEDNQKVVLEQMKEYGKELQEYVLSGGMGLFTGNAFEILGETIRDSEGKEWKGLGLASFMVSQQKKSRLTGDAIVTYAELEEPLVGFINKCSEIEGICSPCFQIVMGMGNEKDGKTEGIQDKEIIGTHLTGPILVKNPYFLLYLVNKLVKKERSSGLLEEEKAELLKGVLSKPKAAYDVTLRELKKRMG